MGIVFLGSEALDGGTTWAQLRTRSQYRRLFPDVYMPRVTEESLYYNTVGAWLWSRRRGPITGRAAAELHGAQWVDPKAPIDLLWNNNRPPPGIITHSDHFLVEDIQEIDGMAVATVARTAYDMGRYLPRGAAVAHLDALARATGLRAEHVAPLIDRYKGAHHIRRLRTAVDLMDGGAQSPKETWLRLLLVDAGYPRPTTQIPVYDEFGHAFAHLDMGWEHVKIAVEYDGEHHGTDADQWKWDVKRLRRVHDRNWLHIKVIGDDRPNDILPRVARAWARRNSSHSG
ncbi:hypothetical protein [Mycolicibacterium arenosum]|uniref:DUF559 domain-containing protein n=1 Tax=Mycolicibacterium arenosum TaxID=2952157 RepID=A0ABT1M2H2_9MYCO|nr:hypothetical protein [Mycolicibacterium sp. CAU 1645]MCP9273306.1 hypothetical protein [Mycolicibacterium sp. CAU 1645]